MNTASVAKEDKTFRRGLTGYDFQAGCRFAPVVPISIAKDLKRRHLLGDYHLLLAHDVLDKPSKYADVYLGEGYTILMDNSLIELGYAMDVKDVIEAARIVGAQYLVLPDTLSDFEATRKQVIGALDQWAGLSNAETKGLGLIGVIQGKHYRDQIECLHFFREATSIMGVSVPRVVAQTCGTRRYLISSASRYYNIHLLGFSDNYMDDIACARMPGVVGIDSAVPIRLGLRGLPASLDVPQDAGKRECYWEDPYSLPCSGPYTDGEKDRMIQLNLHHVRSRIGK